MNKYLILSLFLTLSALAQEDDIKMPEIEMASDTVAVPDIIEPLQESPIVEEKAVAAPSINKEIPVENAAATAPVEESVPELPEDATADTPDYEEGTTPTPSIPAVTEVGEEDKEPEPKLPSTSTPVLSTEIDEERDFSHQESHWQSIFAFESMKYETQFNFDKTDYTQSGTRQKKKLFRPDDLELYGVRLGFGREFYMGAGFTTTSMVEGSYNGTVASKRKAADPDLNDVDISYSKVSGQVISLDASQSLGYFFEAKTKNPFMDEITHFTIQPFIEAGIGLGQSVTKATYQQDTGPGATGIREEYRLKTADKLASARIGAGFNIASRTGFFMFSRITQTRYEVLERNNTGYIREDPLGSQYRGTKTSLNQSDVKDVKLDPITVITVGGGYKF